MVYEVTGTLASIVRVLAVGFFVESVIIWKGALIPLGKQIYFK